MRGLPEQPLERRFDRVRLKPSRIKYWLGVGAQPSEKVAVLFKKYMKKWEEIELQEAARKAEEAAKAANAPPAQA